MMMIKKRREKIEKQFGSQMEKDVVFFSSDLLHRMNPLLAST